MVSDAQIDGSPDKGEEEEGPGAAICSKAAIEGRDELEVLYEGTQGIDGMSSPSTMSLLTWDYVLAALYCRCVSIRPDPHDYWPCDATRVLRTKRKRRKGRMDKCGCGLIG